MPMQIGNGALISATELVIGAYEEVKEGFNDVLYQELQWRKVVVEASLDTSVNPGATSMSYRSRDHRGKGAFRSRNDQSVPTVGMSIDKAIVPIEVGGVSGLIDNEDARQYQMGFNGNLLSETPQIMRMAGERHFESTFFFGDADVGFDAWLDYPNVGAENAPNGAGGSPLWANKTADEIIQDINDTISAIRVDSRLVHTPGAIGLPPSRMAILDSKKVSDAGNMSLSEYILRNNTYTRATGQPLELIEIPYLEDAGAGSVARMVVWEKMDRNLAVPFPLPFDLLNPQERGFGVELFAEYKFGSMYMPYPKSMLYIDGI